MSTLNADCATSEKKLRIGYEKQKSPPMKATCQLCQRCCNHEEVANAHTVFVKKEGKILFRSTDDDFGVDICQVCHKPPFVARLWHKILGKSMSSDLKTEKNSYREVAIANL